MTERAAIDFQMGLGASGAHLVVLCFFLFLSHRYLTCTSQSWGQEKQRSVRGDDENREVWGPI